MSFGRKPGRAAFVLLASLFAGTAQPAAAQFFWTPPDFSAPAYSDAAASAALGLPGATATEIKAGMVWNLRAAINVAALQCQFEPMLLSISTYNAMIAHHDAELDSAQKILLGYFERTAGKGKPGQAASDQYGTRIYSGYSTVQAQRGFCQVAAEVGREAIFAQRGALNEVARAGLPSIRRSLTYTGDQVYGEPGKGFALALPSLDKKCWKKGVLTASCKQAWDARVAAKP
ncbi:MAG: hypothetical protein ABW039_05140 [Sphingobium sp.]